MSHTVKQTLYEGELLFRQGDTPQFFYLLLSGQVLPLPPFPLTRPYPYPSLLLLRVKVRGATTLHPSL